MIQKKKLFSSKTPFVLLFCLFISLSHQNNQRNLEATSLIRTSSSAPSTYDWRDSGKVTSVKDQKDCNAYYAFSTVAFFQSDLMINSAASSDIDLSEQFLTKCLPTGGCNGGSPKDAIELVLKKGGIPNQAKYPFNPWDTSDSDVCYPSQVVKVGDRPMISFYQVTDQQFLKSLILIQPLNIYICSADLKTYGPTSNSNRKLSCNAGNINYDHTVLLVGYTEAQWIIKNSWGTTWGLNGYGYISRNADNDCCIGSQVYLRGNASDIKQCKVQNCETCVEQTYCSKCKPGYYVTSNRNGEQTCVQCTLPNCAQCENSVGYCRTCIYGYALYFPDKTCKVSVIQNCKNIVNGGCKDCHDGYKVTRQFTCVRECSIMNCQTCKDDKSCSKCVQGYQLFVQNKTLICRQNKCRTVNCAACDAKGKCLSCKGSYSLVEDSCVMICNKQNCQKCSEAQNKCQNCTLGYALDFYSHECVVANVKNCAQAYLTKYCSICFDGYQRSDSWEQCNKICNVQNCRTCQSGRSNQCVSCEQGYQLTTSNQSFTVCAKNKCDFPNCTLCNFAGDTCYQCIDNYHVWDATSKACVPYKCHFQNCDKCQTNSTKCQQCKSGMILFIPSGGCMQSPIQNCQALGMTNNTLECWDCVDGYRIDYSNWTACKRICIDTNCIDCADNASICKTCLSGYGLKTLSNNTTQCLKIAVYLPHCLRANSQQTFCYECKQFYYFNNKTLNCQLNQGCPKNCIKCTSKQQELKCECKTKMVWDFINKQCVNNPTDSNCLVIANYTGNQQCFECKDRYTLTDDGKGCTQDCAVNNCDICVHSQSENYPDYCQTCISGYIVTPNMTKCLPCQVDNCETCKSYTQRDICTNCKLGYELKGDGSCKQIQCQQHAVFNGLECACQNSYYKDTSNQQCKSCGTSCKRCTAPDNCVQCSDGYFFKNGTCSACLQNCQSCQNSTSCNLCQQGYSYQLKSGKYYCIQIGLGNEGFTYLSNGVKVRCIPGCGSCIKDYKVCQQCLDGYILKNGTCQKCQQNCKICYNNILTACKSCDIGSILSEQGKCVKSISDNCLSCPTKADICTQCLLGFYLKDQKCNTCGRGCKSCDKNGNCLVCLSGYTLLSDATCEQCIEGCGKCKADALQSCDSGCLDGNYLSSNNNKCKPCPPICRACLSDKNCTKCITGYNLIEGLCKKWCEDPNCYECQNNDTKTCTQCFAGYKISKRKCVQDLECNVISNQTVNTQNLNNGSCQACPNKYYLDEAAICTQCDVMDQNCISCEAQSPANCTQCARGYYIQSGACTKCSSNCFTCRNKDFCYICSEGYYMIEKQKQYSGYCLKCDDNCKTCVDQPTICLTCFEGYTLSCTKVCINSDAISFKFRLMLAFNFYSKKAAIFKRALNTIYGQIGNYHTVFQSAQSGSTVISGIIAIASNETKKGTTFKILSKNIKAGQSIGGIPVESVLLNYNGETYFSDKYNPDNNGGSGGVQGWVIAVAVVCGVVGLVLVISVIVYISKKIKSKKQYQESSNVYDSEGKQTSSQFKKDNPQIGI